MTLNAWITRLDPFLLRTTGFRLWIITALLLLPPSSWAETILVVGDSLSAGYGVEIDNAWVARLQVRLPDDKIVNASISGETSNGGLSRLPRLLQRYTPGIVIVELGANDGLRGFPIQRLRDNLTAMIRLSREQGARVLLLGMRLPPNYGSRYAEAFHNVYLDLAAELKVPLVPFLLEGVATHDDLMQGDGLHPNDRAQGILFDTVWAVLRPLVEARR
ncbi:MAG: arylesterase [Gammaproteobacteria bacterium]|nr:arylesterase [Gammaproteobacteria bacterium]